LLMPTIATMSAKDSMNRPPLRAGDIAMTTGRRACAFWSPPLQETKGVAGGDPADPKPLLEEAGEEGAQHSGNVSHEKASRSGLCGSGLHR
jgi:hypothetical protein